MHKAHVIKDMYSSSFDRYFLGQLNTSYLNTSEHDAMSHIFLCHYDELKIVYLTLDFPATRTLTFAKRVPVHVSYETFAHNCLYQKNLVETWIKPKHNRLLL